MPHMIDPGERRARPARAGDARAEREAAGPRARLELVGLDPGRFGRLWPHQLSGGQRQRVGVARALAADPDLILMDEPFGALDPITRRELQDEFRGLQRRLGTTVIFVTHDIREACRVGRPPGLDGHGRLVQYGTAAELLEQPGRRLRPLLLPRGRGGASRTAGDGRHDGPGCELAWVRAMGPRSRPRPRTSTWWSRRSLLAVADRRPARDPGRAVARGRAGRRRPGERAPDGPEPGAARVPADRLPRRRSASRRRWRRWWSTRSCRSSRTRSSACGASTRGVIEAASGMGMTAWQRLRLVELPLAVPVVLGGVRVATVAAVGMATIAAAIGAKGLGSYIFRGVSLCRPPADPARRGPRRPAGPGLRRRARRGRARARPDRAPRIRALRGLLALAAIVALLALAGLGPGGSTGRPRPAPRRS